MEFFWKAMQERLMRRYAVHTQIKNDRERATKMADLVEDCIEVIDDLRYILEEVKESVDPS